MWIGDDKYDLAVWDCETQFHFSALSNSLGICVHKHIMLI